MHIRSMELNGLSGHDAGRQLLQAMYRELTGETMPEIRIGSRGKPYFAAGGWHFSISHTKKRVFCALSSRPIGIDAEETDRKIGLQLARKILSPTEMERYQAQPDPRTALLRFWVLKEAAAKCTGEGLHGYPNQTDFSPDDPRVIIMDNCFVAIME